MDKFVLVAQVQAKYCNILEWVDTSYSTSLVVDCMSGIRKASINSEFSPPPPTSTQPPPPLSLPATPFYKGGLNFLKKSSEI